MVKIYSMMILSNKTNKPVILSGFIDAGSNWLDWTWLYKDTVREFAVFFSKLLAEKTKPGVRQQVEHEEYVAYVHAGSNGLTGVLVTDKQYPYRVAFDLTRKCLNGFSDASKYLSSTKDFCATEYNETLKVLVQKYQNPTQADSILRAKKDIEDTKIELHKTLETLLERGKKIDDLIQQTDQLSEESKTFYRKARQNKNCCHIL